MKTYLVKLQNKSVEGSEPVILGSHEIYERAMELFRFWRDHLDEQRERGISSDTLELSVVVRYD